MASKSTTITFNRKNAVNIQLSMSAIVHKKSQYTGMYAIDIKAYRAGIALDLSASVAVEPTNQSGIKASVVHMTEWEKVVVVIAANTDVNASLNLAVRVEDVTYNYTIPVKTVADGDPGEKGERGATLRGPQSWSDCAPGYHFESGAPREEWKDVVIYGSGTYSCIKTHDKSADNYPGSEEDINNGYWRVGSPIELLIARIILTQYQLVDNLGVKVIEMRDGDNNIVFLAKDGNVKCNSGTFNNIKVAGNSEFSGTMKAVSGSFKRLKCVDDNGKEVGSITFGSDGQMTFSGSKIWFYGDMYNQGDHRFYAGDVWCRGMFGHFQKTIAVIKGEEMIVYPNGTDQEAVKIKLYQYTSPDNYKYYRIPLWAPKNYYADIPIEQGTSGMPIDVIVFNTSYDNTYFVFEGMVSGKEWKVINGNNKQVVFFADTGGWHPLLGGYSVNCAYVDPDWLSPKPNPSKLGRGVFLAGETELGWQ